MCTSDPLSSLTTTLCEDDLDSNARCRANKPYTAKQYCLRAEKTIVRIHETLTQKTYNRVGSFMHQTFVQIESIDRYIEPMSRIVACT